MRLVLLLLFALVFAGCAHHRTPPIQFPPGDVGNTLHEFYTATDPEKSLTALSELKTPADRAAATPALLAIIDENRAPRSLQAAYFLSEWDPHLAATAPEFHRLLPAVLRGLDASNYNYHAHWSAISSTFLLSRMGPDAITSSRPALAKRFLAPAAHRIEGESPECWTRFVLSGMLILCGADAVPTFIQGLDHSDPWVRRCSADGLAAAGNLAEHKISVEGFPYFTPEQVDAARSAARQALPKLNAQLNAHDSTVMHEACRAFAALAGPADANPRLIDRLLALLADSEDHDRGESIEALAALHPAATPQLLRLARADNDARTAGARKVLVLIGAPVVPDLIALLADEKPFPLGRLVPLLQEMGDAALPALNAALRTDPNPLVRQRALYCYRLNYQYSVQEVKRFLPLDETDQNLKAHRIDIIATHAPAAAIALPALDELVKSAPDANVRTHAQSAAEKIRQQQLPPPPDTAP